MWLASEAWGPDLGSGGGSQGGGRGGGGGGCALEIKKCSLFRLKRYFNQEVRAQCAYSCARVKFSERKLFIQTPAFASSQTSRATGHLCVVNSLHQSQQTK